MKFNQIVSQSDAANAFKKFRDGINVGNGNIIKPDEDNCTFPAYVCQEQPFVNTQNIFTFQFGTNPPQPSASLNNVILGTNNALIVTGIQIILGYGANQNNRAYQSRGMTSSDDSLYNAQMSMVFESNTPVNKLDMLQFYEEGDFINSSGFVPIKPLRVLTGQVSTWNIVITFPQSISTLVLSANMFISVRPWGILALA